jgi:hypothetical protein
VHPRFSFPHALFNRISRYFGRPSRLTLGIAVVAAVIAAVVAAGVSAGGGSAIDTADRVAAASQHPAAHRSVHAKAPAADHARTPAPRHQDNSHHGAANHGAANHGAANHGAANHGAANHGAANHGAANHGATNHGASKHHSAARHHAARHHATRRHRSTHVNRRPYLIYDSVTPSAIASHQNVAAYSNGNYAASPAQVAGHKSVMWIDVTGYNHNASVLDVEPGDATPSMAASWAWHRLKDRPRALARIYTMQSEWPAVQAAVAHLPAKMRSHVRYWIADPTGTPHIVPGSDATQWYWGSSYDISTATPRF